MNDNDLTEHGFFYHLGGLLEMEGESCHLLLNMSVDGFWVADNNGSILGANDALCNLLGYSREELLKCSLSDIEDARVSDEAIVRIQRLTEKEASRYETKYRRKDAEPIEVEVSVNHYSLPESGDRFFAFVRDITDQKEMVRLLREKEKKFRHVFEKAADPILLFKENRCVECNEAAVAFLSPGGKEALVGLRLDEMSPQTQPDGTASLKKGEALVREALSKGQARFQWLCRDGRDRNVWMDIAASVIYGEEEEIICTFWRDISQQRIVEEKLRESEDKFRMIGYSGQDAVVVMDNRGIISYINPAAEKALGYGSEEVLGSGVQKYLALDNFFDAQRLQLGIEEAMPYIKSSANGSATNKALELLTRRKDGREIYIELSLFSEALGNQWRIIGIFRDITERKAALEALRKSEEKYRRLFEETKDIVFLSTPDGQFIDINPAGIDLFGFRSPEEIARTSIPRDLSWDEKDWKNFRETMDQHGFVSMRQMPLKRRNGQRVIVSITANLVHGDDPEAVVYQGIMRDLTQSKKLEEQLFEYQKLDSVGKMIGNIVHNFNNILNIIVGKAQLAKMSGHCTGEVPAYLSSIEDEVFHAADVVEQLLAFGRRKQLDVKTTDVNEIVRDFLKIVHEVVEDGITVKTLYAAVPAMTKVDTARMNQVLLNLVINARDAMSGKGTLTISLYIDEISGAQRTVHVGAKPGRYVVLSVSDTGIGISEETMKMIYEPFFTTDRKGERKGLGLSVVYGIVKQHGGFVDVVSKVGEGATFSIYLPYATEQVRPQGKEEKDLPGGNETILLAEDEPALRDIATAILRTLGYTVFAASDGKEALDIFSSKPAAIDLVLLDVAMPVLNGREAYREMQKIRKDTPVLFATGYSLDGAQTSFIFEEGYEAIQKPYTLNSLGKKIRSVLEKNRKG